jgi:hypothetical protein
LARATLITVNMYLKEKGLSGRDLIPISLKDQATICQ